MTLNDLRTFVAMVDHGSVTRAAAHLRTSQPTVTRCIQRLEAALSTELIDRSAKPARVSAMGMRFYERARMIIRDVEGLRALADEAGQPNGVLRIGAAPTVSDTVGVSAVTQLKRRYPQLRVELGSGWSAELLDKVRLGQLDAAAIMRHSQGGLPDGVVGEHVATHRTAIVAPIASPLKGKVTFRELAAYPWVMYPENGCICRSALQKEFESRDLQLNVAVSDYGVERQLALVAGGAGLGFVPEVMFRTSRCRKKLRTLRVSGFLFEFGISVIHARALGNLTAPVRLFTKVVHDYFGPESTRQRST